MRLLPSPLILPLAALAAACAAPPPPQPAPVSPQERARAREALQPFKRQLMGALATGLQEGPESAIAVCRTRAPEIAAEVSEGGIRVGRTSHRLRNPDNAPEPWVEPLLQHYLDHEGDTEPRAVRLLDGGVAYAEPIYVQPPCLQCHGAEPAEGVRARLAALYPEDRATGFAVGDLRGIFWVRLPPEG